FLKVLHSLSRGVLASLSLFHSHRRTHTHTHTHSHTPSASAHIARMALLGSAMFEALRLSFYGFVRRVALGQLFCGFFFLFGSIAMVESFFWLVMRAK